MNLKKLTNKNGATLIEVIIYLALFSLIFLTIIQFTFSLSDYIDKNKKENEIARTIIYINEQIKNKFSSSNSIDPTQSNFSTSGGKLTLISDEGNYIYQINEQRLEFDHNLELNYLTPEVVNISNFQIEPIYDIRDELSGVKIYFTFSVDQGRIERTAEYLYMLQN